jgi:UDP-glucose 4-epimerase
MRTGQHWLIVGGAGFIGSHFADRLLDQGATVTVYDNFSSGREWHLAAHRENSRLRVVRGDVSELDALTVAMGGCENVIHLASNPDIARAMTDPTVDFWQGTFLTFQVVEAMRLSGARRLLYASGSGIYGERGWEILEEDGGPRAPISTYGASKLAGEALISSYCYMFGMIARAFRFANVIGPRQTHGVGLDFLTRLRRDGERLPILGDGSQSKSYIHVSDIVAAVLCADGREEASFQVYNVATHDEITVNEIAEMAVEVAGLAAGSVRFEHTGGDRGWRGDVPIVRLNSDRIRKLGWSHSRTAREAMRAALESLNLELALPQRSEGSVGAATAIAPLVGSMPPAIKPSE